MDDPKTKSTPIYSARALALADYAFKEAGDEYLEVMRVIKNKGDVPALPKHIEYVGSQFSHGMCSLLDREHGAVAIFANGVLVSSNFTPEDYAYLRGEAE